jgi:hypothetical protein
MLPPLLLPSPWPPPPPDGDGGGASELDGALRTTLPPPWPPLLLPLPRAAAASVGTLAVLRAALLESGGGTIGDRCFRFEPTI